MIIIADTTPINYLTLMGRQELLHELFGQIIIPETVLNELQATKTPEVVKVWVASRPFWIEIRQTTW